MTLVSTLVKNCSVYWFPKDLHAEFALDGELLNLVNFSPCSKAQCMRDEENLLFWSTKGTGADCYRFELNPSKEEIVEIKRYLSADLPFDSCSGNISRLLTKTMKLSISHFKSLLPSGLARELYQVNQKNPAKIPSIQFLSPRKSSPDLKADLRWATGKETCIAIYVASLFMVLTISGLGISAIVVQKTYPEIFN